MKNRMSFSSVKKCKAKSSNLHTDQHYEHGILLLAQYLMYKDDKRIYSFSAMWIGRRITKQPPVLTALLSALSGTGC